MNSLLHPSIDRLYSQIALEYIPEDGILNLYSNLNNHSGQLYSQYSIDSGVGTITSIEGFGIGHKLMIVFLIEMYYLRIQTIHLEATPILAVNNRSVTLPTLKSFYGKFGFNENPIASNPRYPHKVPMVLSSWEGLQRQIQKYIERTILQI